MKRIIAVFLLTGMFLISGCQKTPEEPIVVQKDTDRLVERVESSETEKSNLSIRERYGIPERFEISLEGVTGNMSVTADTEIDVPEVNELPMYRVTLTNFSQEIVSKLFDELCGDYEMMETPQEMTKKEIAEEIISLKRMINDPEYQEQPKYIEEYRERLKNMEQKYAQAPEQLEPIRCEGTIKPLLTYDHVTLKPDFESMGIRAYSRDCSFVVDNGRADETITAGNLLFMMEEKALNFNFAEKIEDEQTVPVLAEGKLSITPDDARKMGQDFLDRLGLEMKVGEIFLMHDENMVGNDAALQKAEHYAYKLNCERLVNGAACAYISGRTNYESQTVEVDEYNAYMPTWRYERMDMLIDDDGIIHFNWDSPLAVGEEISENVELLPYEKIKGIFEKMMLIRYEAEFYEWNQATNAVHLEYKIDRVELCLQRIAEPDSLYTGLLVPAWNFYGGHEYMQIDDHSAPLLSINAIDGSIIDTEKGY